VNPTTILCADWGKAGNKRAVWAADVHGPSRVRRLHRAAWTLPLLLEEAERVGGSGPVLVVLDVPLGVPQGYLTAVNSETGLGATPTFLDLLRWTIAVPHFFDPGADPKEWSLARPFFIVGAGAGGRTEFDDAAARAGVPSLLRHIDRHTNANRVFITAGIPGSVGSSACDVWMSLRALVTRPRSFAVWPFEGSLEDLTSTKTVTLAEVYPRAAYATALVDGVVKERRRMKVAKTDARCRHSAVQQLLGMRWVQSRGVSFEGIEWARYNEDDFDACLTAAALLRCCLEDLPFSQPLDVAAPAEGGILGSGSINLALPEASYRPEKSVPAVFKAPVPNEALSVRPTLRVGRGFQCPIPGCVKVFVGSRGGWDAHVGSPRVHPLWHPEVTEPERRRYLFRLAYPAFLAAPE
jgi:hypothetical protein